MGKIFNKTTFTVLKIVVIIAVIAGIIFGVGIGIDKLSGNYEARQSQKEIKTINKVVAEEKTEELKPASYYSESDIYDVMHRMANSKIVAKDGQIWGQMPMDKDDIKELKDTISGIAYEDRDYLLEVLSRWEAEDFTQCVDEHNYFWGKLGGTIGEAYELKEE